MGTTGAGKSTIVSLLLRFIEPDAGTIRVGGICRSRRSIADWRHRRRWVPQAPRLFHGTIADNIRLGRPDAAIGDVQRVGPRRRTQRAFIEALPTATRRPWAKAASDSAEASVSGSRSPGRCVHRCAAADPRRADSAPGRRRGSRHRRRRSPAHARRTVIVITHRARLAEAADQVVILRDGRVAESALGTRGGWRTRAA